MFVYIYEIEKARESVIKGRIYLKSNKNQNQSLCPTREECDKL